MKRREKSGRPVSFGELRREGDRILQSRSGCCDLSCARFPLFAGVVKSNSTGPDECPEMQRTTKPTRIRIIVCVVHIKDGHGFHKRAFQLHEAGLIKVCFASGASDSHPFLSFRMLPNPKLVLSRQGHGPCAVMREFILGRLRLSLHVILSPD